MGEMLKKMSFAKIMLEGLQYIECEHGIGVKNSPICYIPEQDPIQEALETKTTYFKLTLLNTSIEMMVARWAPKTLKQFFMHVRVVVHICEQMELETKFKESFNMSRARS